MVAIGFGLLVLGVLVALFDVALHYDVPEWLMVATGVAIWIGILLVLGGFGVWLWRVMP